MKGLNYETLKNWGAVFWGLAYACFIVVAFKFELSVLPLLVCAYNVVYELKYTILGKSRGQRLRNGGWFVLDSILIYFHLKSCLDVCWFQAYLIASFAGHWLLSSIYTRTAAKSFAWVITCLMSILLILSPPPFYSVWILGAMLFKTAGDGFYNIAHSWHGIPQEEELGGRVRGIIRGAMYASGFLNTYMILNYLMTV